MSAKPVDKATKSGQRRPLKMQHFQGPFGRAGGFRPLSRLRYPTV